MGGATNTGKTWEWSAEAVEEDLNRLIDRRASEASEADANRVAEAWAESARRYNLAAAAARREAWIRFHADMSVVHSRIAAEHERKAALLSDGEAERPCPE